MTLFLDAVQDWFRDRYQFSVACFGHDLNPARALEVVHREERFGGVAADSKQSVIAKNQVSLVSEIVDESRFLIIVQRKSFVVVIGERRQRKQRLLRDGKQTVLLGGDGDSVLGMKVKDAKRVF